MSNSSPDTTPLAKGLKSSKKVPTSTNRFVILILILSIDFSTFCGQNLSMTLEKEIETEFNIKTHDYTLILSVSGLPVIFLTLLSGFLIEKYGRGIISLIVISGIMIGQFIASMGVTYISYPALMVGVIIINTSLDTWIAAASTYIAVWFKNKEISLAMALDAGFDFLSIVVAFWLAPILYNQFDGLGTPYWSLFILNCFAVICGILLMIMDKRKREETTEGQEEETFNIINSVKNLGLLFWIVLLGVVMVSIPFSLQEMIASAMFQELFGLDNEEGGLVVSMHYVIRAVGYPIAGYVVYRVGKKPMIICIAAVIAIISTFVLLLLPESPGVYKDPTREKYFLCYLPYLVNAVSFVFYSAAIWPMVALVVEEKYVPVAYSVLMAAFDLAYFIAPLIMGYIKDYTTSYRRGFGWVQIYILIILLFGFIDLLILLIYDIKVNKGKLAISDAQIKKDKDNEEKSKS